MSCEFCFDHKCQLTGVVCEGDLETCFDTVSKANDANWKEIENRIAREIAEKV